MVIKPPAGVVLELAQLTYNDVSLNIILKTWSLLTDKYRLDRMDVWLLSYSSREVDCNIAPLPNDTSRCGYLLKTL